MYELNTTTFEQKAREIRLLILDIDGILTDGKLYFTHDGREVKIFHVHDGLGLKMVRQRMPIAIISGRDSEPVRQRMAELGIQHVYLNIEHKIQIYEKLLMEFNLTDAQVAYMGDDLPDLPILLRAGLGITVPNAVESVKQKVHWITTRTGGNGAVREVCDQLLQAQATS